MIRILCILIGYLFGSFQTAYLLGRLKGIDIREHGSGNSGTTNALRVMGPKAGLIVFAGDLGKVFAAAFVVTLLFCHGDFFAGSSRLYQFYTGLGAVFGHNFPYYLNFKGGKGIAVTSGVILMSDYRITIVCLFTFLVVVGITRYVSLGSLLISSFLLIGWMILGQAGQLTVPPEQLTETYLVLAVICGMAFWRHRSNILRLLKGTENKLGAQKE